MPKKKTDELTKWRVAAAAGAAACIVGWLVWGRSDRSNAATSHPSDASSSAALSDAAPPAPPLDARSVDKLVALARLYGYVRFFHPSDESVSVSWDKLLIAGVDRVMRADTPEELATALGEIFTPVGPSVQVWAGSNAPEAPPVPDASVAPTRIGYRHVSAMLGRRTPHLHTSERAREPRAKAPDRVPAEGTSTQKDLGAGVSCRVPLTLVADAQGTLPHAPHKDPMRPVRPDGWSPSSTDRATRLAAVITAWTIPQHFYPYFEDVHADWPAALRKALAKAGSDADGQAFVLTLREMIAELHDGRAAVLGGTPPRVLPIDWTWAGKDLVVTSTRLYSGSAQAIDANGIELRRGDTILAIDGHPTEELVSEVSRVISSASEAHMRVAALTDLRALPTRDPAPIRVRRASGEETTITVPRVAGFQEEPERLPANGATVAPGIVYFTLDQTRSADVDAELPALAHAKGIVFDLRGRPGHAGLTVLRHLTDRPLTRMQWSLPVTTRPDREAVTFERFPDLTAPPMTPRLEAKCAFIIDGRAVGEAESLAATVEQDHLGVLVGEPTAGADGEVNPFEIPGGYIVVWTSIRALRPDGGRNHGVGIRPTLPVSRTARGIADGRDELLEKAISAFAF